MTISAIERSVSGGLKRKLCYFFSAIRAFPVSLKHFSGKFSVGTRIVESHIFTNHELLIKKRPFMTFKPLYLIYAFVNFFGITTAYFKIIRLTSLMSLYSLSKISQGAKGLGFFVENETVPLSTGLFFFLTVLSFFTFLKS